MMYLALTNLLVDPIVCMDTEFDGKLLTKKQIDTYLKNKQIKKVASKRRKGAK